MPFDEAFDVFRRQSMFEHGLIRVADLYIDSDLGMKGWVYGVSI
jgi:hypothetical protein